MAANDILESKHIDERWTTSAVLAKCPDLEADPELAEFVAAAPVMARALKAVLNLDLGEEAERQVRAEIQVVLGRSNRLAGTGRR